MKKILSILLAMVMIISSITIALIAVAEEPATPTAAEVVEKINKQTAYVANADNGDGTTHQLPYYALAKTVSTSVDFGENEKMMNALLTAKYPEYSGEPYCNENGEHDFAAIFNNLIDVKNVDKEVKKNDTASEVIGADAMMPTTLDAADVANVTLEKDDWGMYGGDLITLTYNDMDVVAGDRVEDSVLGDIVKAYPRVTGLDKVIKNSLKNEAGIDFSDFTLKVENIQVKAVFDEDSGRFVSFEYTYTIKGTATYIYISNEPVNAEFSAEVVATYSGFDYEKDAINLAELAQKVNEGTAYITGNKAGYDYARYDDFTEDYKITMSTNGQFKPNTLIGGVLSGLISKVDDIVFDVNKELGTDIHLRKWVCGNGNKECTAKNPCTVWQCTCKDVSGCCTCCPAGTGCTSTNPCDHTICRSADCKCGYVPNPNCGYQEVDKALEEFDKNLDSALQTIGELLNGSIGDTAKKELAIGATSEKIPAGSNASDKLESRFVPKATSLTVRDIESANYNPDTKAITFCLETPDENCDTLSHVTDDYITNEQFVKALKLSVASKLGGMIAESGNEILQPFAMLFTQATLGYSNISCEVKFKGATESNIYGTGEIEKFDISYDCNAEAGGTIGYTFNTHMDSTVKNIDYPNYEKGDVNMDTSVSLMDAKLVLRYVAELETLNDYQMLLADMNEDSAVTIVDAKAILEKIASQTV